MTGERFSLKDQGKDGRLYVTHAYLLIFACLFSTTYFKELLFGFLIEDTADLEVYSHDWVSTKISLTSGCLVSILIFFCPS